MLDKSGRQIIDLVRVLDRSGGCCALRQVHVAQAAGSPGEALPMSDLVARGSAWATPAVRLD